MSTPSSTATLTLAAAAAVNDETKKIKKRQKLETLVTSGCGYGRAKKRLLHAFWNVLWPRLENECGWRKVIGTGEDSGAIHFIPPAGMDTIVSTRGKGYYDKIKAVIDHVSATQNKAESKLAMAFHQELVTLEQLAEKTTVSTTRKTNSAWKRNRRHFMKKCSRVGSSFQVLDLPLAGTFEASNCYDSYDQIWDPEMAKCSGKVNLVHLTVPHNKKEQGMVILHKHGYDLAHFYEALRKVKPLDGSDWSPEDKQDFHLALLDSRKDLSVVTKTIQKSMNNCLAYYFGSYKQSDDYKLMKVICSQGQRQEDDLNDDVCNICYEGGSLLCCDSCDNSYHLYCLTPPLSRVPEGTWECAECINRKTLDARDILMKENMMMEGGGNNIKRQKTAHEDTERTNRTDFLSKRLGTENEPASENDDTKDEKKGSNYVGNCLQDANGYERCSLASLPNSRLRTATERFADSIFSVVN